MIRIHSGFLVISARHLKLKNGVWWYQRRNPKDLRERFGLPAHVRKSLSTRDPSEAAVRARTLNATIEVGWGRLRAAPGQEATEVLAGQDKGSEEPLALQPSQEQQRLHDLLRASDGGVGSPPALQGPQVGFVRPEPLLTEALAIYLRQHPKGSDKRFAGNTGASRFAYPRGRQTRLSGLLVAGEASAKGADTLLFSLADTCLPLVVAPASSL